MINGLKQIAELERIVAIEDNYLKIKYYNKLYLT